MNINKNLIGPMTVVLGVLTAVFFGFQNCSDMSFENADPTLSQKAEGSFIVEPLGDQTTTDTNSTATEATRQETEEQTSGQSSAGDQSSNQTNLQDEAQTDSEEQTESEDGEPSVGRTCNIEIADIMVNVLRIEALAKGGWITIQSDIGSKSLFELAAGLAITSTEKLDTNQIRLILAESGNFLKGVDNQEYKLTTPSGQESGLKVNLRGRTEFLPNQAVLIKFHLDPGSQIHKAGDKCMLQPVFQAD